MRGRWQCSFGISLTRQHYLGPLNLNGDIAANEQAPEALPIHLLKGLATTDGIASELLRRCGLTALEVPGNEAGAMSCWDGVTQRAQRLASRRKQIL